MSALAYQIGDLYYCVACVFEELLVPRSGGDVTCVVCGKSLERLLLAPFQYRIFNEYYCFYCVHRIIREPELPSNVLCAGCGDELVSTPPPYVPEWEIVDVWQKGDLYYCIRCGVLKRGKRVFLHWDELSDYDHCAACREPLRPSGPPPTRKETPIPVAYRVNGSYYCLSCAPAGKRKLVIGRRVPRGTTCDKCGNVLASRWRRPFGPSTSTVLTWPIGIVIGLVNVLVTEVILEILGGLAVLFWPLWFWHWAAVIAVVVGVVAWPILVIVWTVATIAMLLPVRSR